MSMKITKFVDLGAERNFQTSVERADKYQRASPELRLARVLRGLLLQDRVCELLWEIDVDLHGARHKEESLLSSQVTEEAADLMRDVAYSDVKHRFRRLARKVS
jgi:hypothetical protein